MRKRPVEQIWRTALTVIALAATAMALYLQLFERRARQEEARLAAVRLDDALVESRARLRSEIVSELRAELRKDSRQDRTDAQPIPDAILRRLEKGGNASGALEQALDALPPQEALLINDLNETLESLARQVAEADRSLRKDLEELRSATLSESDVSSKIMSLMLVALLCLVVQMLRPLWPHGNGVQEEQGTSGRLTSP